jgi:hypothetical protein
MITKLGTLVAETKDGTPVQGMDFGFNYAA